uniref:Uncharacterized protein n=1 Tax=viral metagenome TaxID=1070528 RepID=A0A6C0I3X3_9ZZZZ
MALTTQIRLNEEIMNVYDSIKEWRSFDNGYTNCQYSFFYTNIEEVNRRFRENMIAFLKEDGSIDLSSFGISDENLENLKDLQSKMIEIEEDGDEDFVEKFMYELGLIVRRYDGHTIDQDTYIESDNEENSEYYDEDYQDITELKGATSSSAFLTKMQALLSKEDMDSPFGLDYSGMDVDASTYFTFIYKMLLKSMTPVVGGGKTKRKRCKRGSRRNRLTKRCRKYSRLRV